MSSTSPSPSPSQEKVEQDIIKPSQLCEKVRSTCRQWMEDEPMMKMEEEKAVDTGMKNDNQDRQFGGRRTVAIQVDHIPKLADDIRQARSKQEQEKKTKKKKQQEESNKGSIGSSSTAKTVADYDDAWIEWDEEEWHYTGNGYQQQKTQQLTEQIGSSSSSSSSATVLHSTLQKQRKERVGLYILALDAINFCFWPVRQTDNENNTNNGSNKKNNSMINPLEYEHLAIALKKLAELDDNHDLVDENHQDNEKNDDDDGDGRNDGVVKVHSSYVFSPQNLSTMTIEKMETLLRPYLTIKKDGNRNDDDDDDDNDAIELYLDNMEQRVLLWKEIGSVLQSQYHGSITYFLSLAKQDGPTLVDLVYNSFPGFQDHVVLDHVEKEEERQGQQQQNEISVASTTSTPTPTTTYYFLKRAQIFVGDVDAALQLNMENMNQLTTFADYRVPQILRYYNILYYHPKLASIIDDTDDANTTNGTTNNEIERKSFDEISIRAATVTAVEELVTYLNNGKQNDNDDAEGDGKDKKFDYTAVTVDWYLWQVGERMHQQGLLKPFHKVRTTFY